MIIDFQDAATPGVQSAIKDHPDVKYIGTMFDYKDLPGQTITNVAVNYDKGYLSSAELFKDKKLQPKVYPSGVQNGGLELTDFADVSASVSDYGKQLFADIKSGKVKVDLAREIKN